MTEKRCSSCKEVRAVSEFRPDKRMADGVAPRCNCCRFESHSDKRCSKCGSTKPLDNFYKRGDQCGYASECAACHGLAQKERIRKRDARRPPKPVVTEKQCIYCHELKPVSELVPRKTYCRECDRARARARSDAFKATANPTTTGTKVCTGCSHEKLVTEFFIARRTKSGRGHLCKLCGVSNSSQRRRNNAETYKTNDRRRYEAHRDKRLPQGQARYQRTKDAVRKYARQRYLTKRDEINKANRERYAQNRIRYREASRRWQANNRPKRKIVGQRRRARKRNVTGAFSYEEWASLVNKFDGRCTCCGKYFGIEKLEPDHVIPLDPGSNGIENIQPLCKPCNSAKGRRHTTDYRSTPFLGKGQQRLL